MSRGTVHKLIFTAVQVLQYSVVQHIWYNKTVFLVLNSTCSVQYNVHVSYCTHTLYFSVHSTSLLVQYIQDVRSNIIIMALDTLNSTYRMHKGIVEKSMVQYIIGTVHIGCIRASSKNQRYSTSLVQYV